MRLAYADPPYPGCAHLYPEKTEVDHAALIERLCTYDGWALSTNENALQTLLGMCPPGVRVLAWCKPNAPPFFTHPYRSWEPVICVPARQLEQDETRNYLVAAALGGFLGATLIGAKPPTFSDWLFRCLGAVAGDSLDDLFPGSGWVSERWERWERQGSLLAPERPESLSGQGKRRARAAALPSLFAAAPSVSAEPPERPE